MGQGAVLHVEYSVIAEYSFSHKDLGVTQSLHGNVYKVVNYEGQVTMCNYNFTLM